MCPVQDFEVVIDWSSVVMLGAIKMSNSPFGGASEFSCPPESVDRGCVVPQYFAINRF